MPTGSYTARTLNSLGYVDERYNNQPCLVDCSPAGGDPIDVVAAMTTAGINFSLDPDGDLDGDGIVASIDTGPGYSAAFSDVPQGGSTEGMIADRGGWNVGISDISPGGVQVAMRGGPSASAAILETCSTSGSEEVWLDAAGEMASVQCAADTGSTTVKALATMSSIQLRKTVGGLTTNIVLISGQTATLGSPVVADPGNVDPLQVTLLDSFGSEVGSFSLDPGESADAVKSSSGVLSMTVFSGTVTVTVGNEAPVTLRVGQTHGFILCTPLGIEQLAASPAVLWPANHRLVPVTLSPSLAGTCGTATFEIISVTSNEPTNALGDGETAPDWVVGAGLTLKLRAERSGAGPGRVYTVVVRGTDEAGNSATKTVTVSVPHDR